MVGLAWGAAMLSKYFAVFLPVGFVFFAVLEPKVRPCLRKPGPYLALVLGLLLFSPVLWWNHVHGWGSFAFQGRRALGGLTFQPGALLAAVGGQAFYLFPWVWAFLVVELVRRGRGLFGGTTVSERFFLCQAIPPLALFFGVACTRRVLPHWTLVGVLPLYPLLGQSWAGFLETRGARRMRRMIMILAALPILIAGLTIVQARTGLLFSGTRDPTLDFFGWDQVARGLEGQGLLSSPDPFLFTSRWYYSGHIAFASRNAVPILCYNANHAQGFACWNSPDDSVGRDGIFIGFNDCSAEVEHFARWFERVEPLDPFPVLRNGVPVRWVRPFRFVRQTKPYPFGNTEPLSHADVPGLARSVEKIVD
jgi:hypothetical protein